GTDFDKPVSARDEFFAQPLKRGLGRTREEVTPQEIGIDIKRRLFAHALEHLDELGFWDHVALWQTRPPLFPFGFYLPKKRVGFSPRASYQLCSQTPQPTYFQSFSSVKVQFTSSNDNTPYTSLFPGFLSKRLSWNSHKPGKYFVPFSPVTCVMDS